MQLKLVIPGLCGPLPELKDLQDNSSCQSLARILSRGDRFQNTVSGFESELATVFGKDVANTIPSALLSLIGNDIPPGDGFWLHADPVNFQADMDHAVLRDSDCLDIQQQEADRLISVLNDHFSNDDIQIIAADASHWYLNINKHAALHTTPLYKSIGRNVKFIMPSGNDEVFWNSFMNEAQMLFHMDTVNLDREKSGKLAINGIWIWGESELPVYRKVHLQQVFSNHVLAKGLAAQYNIKCKPIENIDALLNAIDAEVSTLIVLDKIFSVTCYGDVRTWQETIIDLYEQWIKPILTFAYKRGLTIDLYPCNGVHYCISASNRFRLFRSGSIKQHVTTYE